MRHPFKFHRIDKGERFVKIPLLDLEKILYNKTDLIVLRGDEQMWLNEVDLIFHNIPDEVDDAHYIVSVFEFIPDVKTLNATQLVFCSKFHQDYLNITEFWNYINSQEFINVLLEVNTARQKGSVIPAKENMFDVLNTPKGSVELLQSLTYLDGMPMMCWNKLLTICKQN